ncbi:hypothetical protein K443DRAFT_616765 [Laccaria amethystina LaAM-08-1]|uniref:Uncharacterized protein n=1 Tax=Laccaria amethystina LaAM-08-1 TaxID=1095629 RepID=A0A0C9XEU4_9AGAR|nr:hypothetical protein K443DRAFT_616765 [Laccaria amethystina LaAM-08-1]
MSRYQELAALSSMQILNDSSLCALTPTTDALPLFTSSPPSPSLRQGQARSKRTKDQRHHLALARGKIISFMCHRAYRHKDKFGSEFVLRVHTNRDGFKLCLASAS